MPTLLKTRKKRNTTSLIKNRKTRNRKRNIRNTKNTKNTKNKINKRNKKILRGGAKCPTTGFHQHSGECWNDSMMMNLCYSNGIGDKIQTFFQFVKSTTVEEKTNDEIKEIIKKILSECDEKEYKEQYFFLSYFEIVLKPQAVYLTHQTFDH